MSLWEYKVITSGKGGFASPALLEKFLNDLGREEWEIVHFQTLPDNFLAFTGMARRSTQRDWTLQDAAAAAAKAEAEKLRAEFEAKFRAASGSAPVVAEERAPSFLEEKSAPDDGLRKLVDTSHDDEPETAEEETDDWDKLTAAEHDELPTFFDAIKPHMRRNQRGPGMSVGVDYLAKKWDQTEEDLRGALIECGFVMPADEDAKTEYVEFDGDLYWLNINRRGELWINTKEKPRPVFRPVKAARIEVEPAPPKEERPAAVEAKPPTVEVAPEVALAEVEGAGQPEKPEVPKAKPVVARPPGAPLPEGVALLAKIRPHMRRNRRGPGGSGSTTFLARALRTNEADIRNAFVSLGLTVPATPADKPVYTEIGEEVWWLNLDSRGGMWINGREKLESEADAVPATAEGAAAEGAPAETPLAATPAGAGAETAAPVTPATVTEATVTEAAAAEAPVANAPAESAPPAIAAETGVSVAPAPEMAPAPIPTDVPAATASPLAAVRLLLKETKTGAVAGKIERLAEELGKSPDELVATLVAAGLKVPDKAREKPAFVELAGEILWFNRNAKGELWLNAKASKFADSDDDSDPDKPRRGIRSRGRKPAE